MEGDAENLRCGHEDHRQELERSSEVMAHAAPLGRWREMPALRIGIEARDRAGKDGVLVSGVSGVS